MANELGWMFGGVGMHSILVWMCVRDYNAKHHAVLIGSSARSEWPMNWDGCSVVFGGGMPMLSTMRSPNGLMTHRDCGCCDSVYQPIHWVPSDVLIPMIGYMLLQLCFVREHDGDEKM
eukprot:783989_1